MTPRTALLSIRFFAVAAFAAILFLTAAPPVTRADDTVVAEMELEITIREISKETLKLARKTAWASVKKTTLYAKYERAQKERKSAVSEELAKAVESASAAWKEASAAWQEASRAWPRVPQEEQEKLWNESRRLFDEYQKLSDERLTVLLKARDRVDVVADEVKSLVDKFARRIYRREMAKRLTELKIKVTEKVLKQIDRSYKHHEA